MRETRLKKACPCMECGDRKVTADYNCHSHCEKYKTWHEALDAEAEAIKRSKPQVITKNFGSHGAKYSESKLARMSQRRGRIDKRRYNAIYGTNSFEKGVHKND